MKPTYSICVVCYKRMDRLLRFMKSLYKYPPLSPWELLVVGSAMDHGDEQDLFDKWPDSIAVYISLPRRVPVGVAHNINFTTARGEYTVICDDDIEFLHDGWAERMRAAIEETGAIAASAASLVPHIPDPRVYDDGNDGGGVAHTHDPEAHRGKRRTITTMEGYCWMVPTVAFDPSRVGLWHTFGWRNCDDIDWSRRATAMGYKVVVALDALVEHEHTPQEPGTARDSEIILSMMNYIRWGRLGMLGYKLAENELRVKR